jgi:polar amino acid transport system ATP-binding protein
LHHLEIVDLKASYGDLPVLEQISLTVGKGEIVSLIGPSGSGKSTLDYGNKKAVRAVRDRFAIVFQQYNLFQNMTVLQNVTVAPVKVKKRKAAEVESEAKELLAKVGLADKFKSYPDELSGGQQQRVAIARALALRPEILLLDEVTSALDPELVNEVLDAIRLLAAEGMTMFIVSHEMGFVREVSSKVVFMADGRVVEVGAPNQIFDNPREARTQDFVGKILRH